MAAFGSIPLPQQQDVFKDVFDYLQRQRELAQNAQYQQGQLGIQRGNLDIARQGEQRAQTLLPFIMKEYQDNSLVKRGNLNIAQQAEQRAQRLMPLLIQQYQDAHGKAMTQAQKDKLYLDVVMQAMMGGDQTNPAPANPVTTVNPQVNTNALPPEMVAPVQTNQVVPTGSINASPNNTAPNNSILAPENREKLKSFLTNNPNLPADQKNQINQFLESTPTNAINPASNNVQNPTATQGADNAPQTLVNPSDVNKFPIGQEVTVKAGNPNMANLDKVAGLIPGIPEPKTHFSPDGMVITRYPSGRITALNTGSANNSAKAQEAKETPEQKQKRMIKTAIDIDEGKRKNKEATSMKADARSLVKSAGLAMELKKLLAENPKLTGWGARLAASSKTGKNPKQAAFITSAGALQGELAKYVSRNGGIQSVQWAKSVKPDLGAQPEFNTGMVDETLTNTKRDFDNLKKEYKQLTGEDLNLDFPGNSTDEMVDVKDNVTGKVTKMTRKEFNKLVGGS